MSRIDKEKAVFNLLVAKYQVDPAWFKRNLPDVIPFMEDTVSPPRPSQPPFRLSDRERMSHLKALSSIRGADNTEPADAIKALEHCAILLKDRSLPYDMNHQERVSVFKSAFGKSPNSFRKDTTIWVDDAHDTKMAFQVSFVRGVILNLNAEMRLMSVVIIPRKVREREKLMSIVGIARDPKSDVSVRHDEYLSEQISYGSP